MIQRSARAGQRTCSTRQPLSWFVAQGHSYEDGLDLLAFGVDPRIADRYLAAGGTTTRAIELAASGFDLSQAAAAMEQGMSHREVRDGSTAR